MHRDTREIIRIAVLVKRFTAEIEKGQHSFQFKISLPEWLPDSLKFISKPKNEKFFVEYTVRAYMRTNNFKDYCVDKQTKDRYAEPVSLYRGSREIQVYQSFRSHPEILFRGKLEQKVGGFMGLGISYS